MQVGPKPSDLVSFIQEHYATKLHHLPGEIGNCKKVLQLGSALNTDLNKVGLALTRYCESKDKELIEYEYQYLTYLKENGYPVISLHSNVFEITAPGGKVHYGMLMDYVKNATFIEAKTPSSLSLMLFSALLNIKTYPQEAWLALREAELCAKIRDQLQIPSAFQLLRQRAAVLYEKFSLLIEKLEADKLAIADLQILITPNGELTIIDPLDIVNFNPEEKTAVSLFQPKKKSGEDFISFLLQTKNWLERARSLCKSMIQAQSPTALEEFLHLRTNGLYFSQSDPKGKSRIAQLRSTMQPVSPPQEQTQKSTFALK